MNPPSRDLIRRIVFDPGFWDGYLDRDDEEDPPEWTSLSLLTAGERTLGLEVMLHPTLMRVILRHGDAELPQLGYDDAAEAYLPWIFRWDELDRIARLAALRDPDLRHPGPFVALLSRFTPMTTSEERAVAQPVLAAALRALDGEPLAYHLEHWDNCAAQGGYRWVQDGGGWVLQGEYTMRERANPEFPHRDLAVFMGDVDAALAATVEPGWRAVARAEADPAELARRLGAAGCEHPVILRALVDAVDAYETGWVLDLLRG
ncbi:hypothetical protein [Actinoplanes aureus]|uniref:Uncharacterized protein n=1 Tax=Actinoplanes aureus TaxID=2792083 RepID=A0A931C971_9ACTN|nr:hypothetical protein [Actinoplanes aureus]MBG0564484.1 hypothetical protein [Actinoplanes aureus]